MSIAFGEAYRQVREGRPPHRYETEYLETVSDRLRIWPEGAFDKIRPELIEALQDGESYDQMQDRVGAVLGIDSHTRELRARITEIETALTDPDSDLDRADRRELAAERRALWTAHDESLGDWQWKARRIARTEAHGAVEWARMKAAEDAAFESGDQVFKRWRATKDARVRPTHRIADGQVVKLGERFQVGLALLLYPGDTSVDAPSETIQCRCTSSLYSEPMVQEGLQGPDGSIGKVEPGGVRIGPDDPDAVETAVSTENATDTTTPDTTAEASRDVSALDDDELVDLMAHAHDTRDDDLYDAADDEWERRRAAESDVEDASDAPDGDDGWRLRDDEVSALAADRGYRPAARVSDDDWSDLDSGQLEAPARADGSDELGAILTAQGWDGPVQELADADFEAVAEVSPHPRIYRGVQPVDGTDAPDLQRAFIDEDSPWIGSGVSGDGWYFSDARETAIGYAGQPDVDSTVGREVIEAVLRPAARLLEAAELMRARVPRTFWSEYAARRGYDGIVVPSPRLSEFYYVVLNRSAIVVRRISR